MGSSHARLRLKSFRGIWKNRRRADLGDYSQCAVVGFIQSQAMRHVRKKTAARLLRRGDQIEPFGVDMIDDHHGIGTERPGFRGGMESLAERIL